MNDPEKRLRLLAPCKINLYLELVGRRPDGYHDVRTVMQAVSLCDELELAARGDGQVALTCSEPTLPTGEENLVVRAARLLQGRCGARQGANIFLRKAIPVGGGLGGGSADAAVALLGLARLWGVEAGREELARMAAELGSDVPFFLRGGTALCEGRGERVKPVPCAGPFHFVLVMPPYAVSTREVYSAAALGLTSQPDTSTKVIEAVERGEAGLLSQHLRNDLQRPALDLHEGLREVWNKLADCGKSDRANGLLMSGSGSGFFVVARDAGAAARAAERLQPALRVPCRAVHSLPVWDFDCSKLTTRRAHR